MLDAGGWREDDCASDRQCDMIAEIGWWYGIVGERLYG
jgi:hypothetical protein